MSYFTVRQMVLSFSEGIPGVHTLSWYRLAGLELLSSSCPQVVIFRKAVENRRRVVLLELDATTADLASRTSWPPSSFVVVGAIHGGHDCRAGAARAS